MKEESRKKVVAIKNLPMKPPIWSTLVLYLLFKDSGFPGWAWGATGVLMLILWAVAIYSMCRQTQVDLFRD